MIGIKKWAEWLLMIFKGNFYVYNGDIVGFRAQNPDIVY